MTDDRKDSPPLFDETQGPPTLNDDESIPWEAVCDPACKY